jgi:transposase
LSAHRCRSGPELALLAESVELVIGVDTHKHTHTAAVVVAATGAVLEQVTVPATPAGYRQLLTLAGQQPGQRVWAIEGTGGYGAGLTRFLHAHAEQVVELDRPKRATRRHGTKSDPLDAIRAAREALAHRIQLLNSEVAEPTRAITTLVRLWRPDLLTRCGMGPIVAAIVLCAWPRPGRCPSDAAFAMLGGAAPIPASCGQTVRVRLNRSGDRRLNQALHLVVLTRLRDDPATRAYAQRRRAHGKTDREIRRRLVRDVARQLFRLLEHQAGPRRLAAVF